LLHVGLLFALLTFAVGEFVTPLSEKTAQRMRIKATDSVVAQDFRSGLWVKDGNSFVNVETVSPDAGLQDIHIYEFDSNFHLRTISNAKNAHFTGDSWNLNKVSQTFFGGEKISTRYYE